MRLAASIVALAALFCFLDSSNAQIIVAHRGASFDAPENTIAAFRLAWEKQADAIEGDFYLTKDQQIVCIHDKSTKRVAPNQCKLVVAESTLSCLRSLDVGRWKGRQYAGERIPTLREVLKTVPEGKQIFVEIKCGIEILPPLQRQLRASGLQPEQIIIISFNPTVVTQARQIMPEYKANWLTSYKRESERDSWMPCREDVVESLLSTGATGLGSHGNVDVLDSAFVAAIRAANREFHVWTINEVADAKFLMRLGADSITTDRPAFIRKGLASSHPIVERVGASDHELE